MDDRKQSRDDERIAGILRTARTFAVVGASANADRPSYVVMQTLLAKGYGVIPINPGLAGSEILGQRVYGALRDVPTRVDVVDIFRNSEAALGVVEEALSVKGRLGIKVVWMQLGVVNDEAAAKATAAGLDVVMDRCPKIELSRLV